MERKQAATVVIEQDGIERAVEGMTPREAMLYAKEFNRFAAEESVEAKAFVVIRP